MKHYSHCLYKKKYVADVHLTNMVSEDILTFVIAKIILLHAYKTLRMCGLAYMYVCKLSFTTLMNDT